MDGNVLQSACTPLVPTCMSKLLGRCLASKHTHSLCSPSYSAQVRGEFICIALAAFCALAPDLEERLKQVSGSGLVLYMWTQR